MSFHPRALLDAILTYPRYLGSIKPGLLSHSAAEANARLRSMFPSWWPKELEVLEGKRILVLSPHPDDESIGCGGFLLRHRGKSSIHLLVVYDGGDGGRLESGHWEDTPAYKSRLIVERRRETAIAAKRLGAESVEHLDFRDGAVLPNLGLALQLRAAIDRTKPDIILLPWFLDRHRDHRIVNVLFAWACRNLHAMVLSFEIWEMLAPNAIMDITDVLEEKLDIVSGYRTQTATVDYVGFCRSLAGTRAFYNRIRDDHTGAVEGFFALPCQEYCELVCSLYGQPGALSSQGTELLA